MLQGCMILHYVGMTLLDLIKELPVALPVEWCTVILEAFLARGI